MLTQKLTQRGAEFLGVDIPILAGAMTWVSDSTLTAAVSEAGGFGVLAAGNTPPDILEKEIDACFQKTKKNFGVNVITVSPSYLEQLAVIAASPVKYVIFAGGIPHPDQIKQAKDTGKKVIAFAPTLKFAQRLERIGVDALIIEGHEAGGHIGPVTTMILIQEILFHMKNIPIFVAGGIGTGKMMAHLLLMGASGLQLGTRFVLSEEANVHEKMKKEFLRSEARDAVVSFGITKDIHVIPVRALKNKGHQNFLELQVKVVEDIQNNKLSKEEGSIEVEKFWLGALRRATQEGDIDFGSLMAGESVGLFKDILPVKQIIENYKKEIEESLQEAKNLLS
jgi:enoyl-[acyl-carrier protein] reductase II